MIDINCTNVYNVCKSTITDLCKDMKIMDKEHKDSGKASDTYVVL